MGFVKKLSLASRGLRRKLIIVFSLTSIIPITVLLNYIFPSLLPSFVLTYKLIYIAIAIAILGFWMLKEIIDSVLTVSSEAKIIAGGDYSRSITIRREDEIGDLSIALNQMTSRIKSNMQELRQYSEKTRDINIDIHRRVGLLSGLLQITELVSQGEKIDSVLQLTLDKLTQVASSDFACYLACQEKMGQLRLEAASGLDKNKLPESKLELNKKLFGDLFENKVNLAIDSQSATFKDASGLREIFGAANILLFSVASRGKIIGILAVGNNVENFTYRKEDLETVDIFAKQISVCIENDQLQKKVKSLEIKDALTGLFNKPFIEEHLDDEIKKAIAYQKPCALIILNIDNFKVYHAKFGALLSESVLKRVAALLESLVSEIDIIGRVGDDEFAIILPARNKRQAMALSENIKDKIQDLFSKEEGEKRITISDGISENPLDGSDGTILISKAKEVLFGAKTRLKK